MKKYILLFIFTIMGIATLDAQKDNTDANLIGDVQCNGEHVPYIYITIDGTTLGTTTDATGHFQIINIPEGTYTVRASGIGYKTATQAFTANKDETTEIKFVVEEDILNLGEVVVSADRNQTNRQEAPVVVTSISPKLFERTQSVNLSEVLRFSPGLRTETKCQNCGFTQLRMNGMEGAYTQILMNSRPVFSGLAGVYGLELVPSNMIERLEVVRGGGSSLFGGNAIAGTVNIITKETLRNTYEIDNRFGLVGVSGEYDSPAVDEQLNINAAVISDDKKTGGYIYTMLRDRSSFDANGDGYTEMVKMKNTTFGFNVYHKPGSKSKISLDGYRIDEYRRGGNKLDYLPHEADIAEQLRHLITGGNLAYDLYTNGKNDKLTVYAAAQSVERGSYYGAEQDPNAYGNTDDISSSLGAQYVLNATDFIFPASSTVFGIDNNSDYMKDMKLGANGGNNTIMINQYINTFGSFIQQDWKSDKFNVSVGMRYDNYIVKDLESEDSNDIRNSVLMPRLSLLYKITPDIRIRAGYAKGYRAPQVFNEDLHIELINALRVQTINSDDLKQETSHSFTASLNMDFYKDYLPTNFLIEGFYTLLKDPFSSEWFELDDDGNFAYLRENSESGAYVAGINGEFKSFITDHLEAQIGFTVQKSMYESAKAWGEETTSVSKKFIRTPNQYGFATLNWNSDKHWNANLSFNYTGPMLVPHLGLSQQDYDDALENGTITEGDVIVGEILVKSKKFLTADLMVSYDFNLDKNNESKIQIYMGIKNMFDQFQSDYDKGVYRDAGYIYGPSQPRTINIGIKLSKL